jgi:hypothetical protein
MKSTIPADPYDGAAVLQDDAGVVMTYPWCSFDTGCFVGRDAVDLRRMKYGVVLQSTDHLPTVLGIVVFNLVGFGEKDGRGLLALSDLPVFALRLLTGHPARVWYLERISLLGEGQFKMVIAEDLNRAHGSILRSINQVFPKCP